MSHQHILASHRPLLCISLACASPALAQTQVLVSQQPAPNGGVSRWSQLWQDPGPNGNDLDSDAVCWQDFVLSAPASIDHIEWWGTGACELGFQIEVWRQDPGTIAYQPLGVFYYGGVKTVKPEAKFKTTAQPCFADCDASGTLTIDDFICFQTLFAIGDPAADCDTSGTLNIDDFVCFQTLFALGC
jgi:hypothetical protein